MSPIDVYIYESEADRAEGQSSEAWEGVPCAPRVGDTVFLRRELGRAETRPVYKVVAVEWFNARDRPPSRLHAYVTVEAVPRTSP